MLEQDRGECAPTSGSDATAPVTSRVGKPQHNYAFTALFVLLWRYIRIRCQRSPGTLKKRTHIQCKTDHSTAQPDSKLPGQPLDIASSMR